MKYSIIATLLFTWALAAFAEPPSLSSIHAQTPVAASFNEDFALTRIKSTLTSGVWKTAKSCLEITQFLQFDETGTARVITEKGTKKPELKHLVWRVEVTQNDYFLIWSDPDFSNERIYELKKGEAYMVLNDPARDVEIGFEKLPIISSARQQFLENSLQGSWENATYPFITSKKKHLKEAFFHYSFHPNGLYEIHYGHKKAATKETGKWEISRNGQFIIFQPNDTNKKAHLVKILHLDLDEMVLAQDVRPKDKEAEAEWRSLTFVK